MDSILSIYWTNTRGPVKLSSIGGGESAPGGPISPSAGGRPMSVRFARPHSFLAHNRNLRQEAGGAPAGSTVKILGMTRTAVIAMLRCDLRSLRLGRRAFFLVLLV